MTPDIFKLIPSLRCLSDSETPIAVHQKPLSTLSVLVHHIPSSPLYYHLYEGIIRIARAEATLTLDVLKLPNHKTLLEQFSSVIIAYMALQAKNPLSPENPIIVRGPHSAFITALQHSFLQLFDTTQALSLRTTSYSVSFSKQPVNVLSLPLRSPLTRL